MASAPVTPQHALVTDSITSFQNDVIRVLTPRGKRSVSRRLSLPVIQETLDTGPQFHTDAAPDNEDSVLIVCPAVPTVLHICDICGRTPDQHQQDNVLCAPCAECQLLYSRHKNENHPFYRLTESLMQELQAQKQKQLVMNNHSNTVKPAAKQYSTARIIHIPLHTHTLYIICAITLAVALLLHRLLN